MLFLIPSGVRCVNIKDKYVPLKSFRPKCIYFVRSKDDQIFREDMHHYRPLYCLTKSALSEPIPATFLLLCSLRSRCCGGFRGDCRGGRL